MITVNGTKQDFTGKTVAEYLDFARYDKKRVAVEQNGRIVPRAKYEETALYNGDSLEIVRFVGGG